MPLTTMGSMSTSNLAIIHRAKLAKVFILSILLFAFVLQFAPLAQASVESDFLIILNAERANLENPP